MTNVNKTIFLIIILIFNTIIIYPQWSQTNGPYGGRIFSLAMSGNTIFAGTGRGIYLSSNSGLNWEQANDGLPTTIGNINALAIYGNNIYAGIGGGGVYLSTNNGSSWSGINNGLPSTVYALAVDSGNIFAGIYGYGVYRSTDNGSSWTDVNNGLINKYINTLAISESNVFAGANLGGSPSGVFLTTDYGSNWSKINNGLTDTLVSSIAISGSYVFAGTTTGAYRSTNNGKNWYQVSNGLPENTFVRSLVVNDNKIFAGTDKDGVYLSTDNGLNWSYASNGIPVSTIWTLAMSGDTVIAGTNGLGLYISIDNGSHWNESNNGLINTSINSMVIGGNNIFATGGIDGIYLSRNEGSSWSHVNNGLTFTYIYTLALSGNNVFAGTSNSGIFMSSDSGASWSSVNNGIALPNNENFISLKGRCDTIIAGTFEGRVYLSNSHNINWTCIGDFGAARSINATVKIGNKIFAAIGQGNGSGGVWLTTDYGANWTEHNTGLFSLNDVWDIAMSGNNILTRVTGNGTGEDGVFISSNYGTCWHQVLFNNLPMTGKGPFAVSGNKIFFGTSYFSTDNGISWNSINNDGMQGSSVNTIALSDSKIYAGTNGDGIWSRFQNEILPVELTDLSSVVKQNTVVINWKTATEINNHGFNIERSEHSSIPNTTKWEKLGFVQGSGNSNSPKKYSFTDNTINGNGEFNYRLKQIDNDGKIKYSKELNVSVNYVPQVYSLENNFPNPFNPGTVIKYSLPYESNVKLTIYNTLGMFVQELISEVQQPGLHEYKYTATGLSSGVYLYTIQASSIDRKENYRNTKKMILMK